MTRSVLWCCPWGSSLVCLPCRQFEGLVLFWQLEKLCTKSQSHLQQITAGTWDLTSCPVCTSDRKEIYWTKLTLITMNTKETFDCRHKKNINKKIPPTGDTVGQIVSVCYTLSAVPHVSWIFSFLSWSSMLLLNSKYLNTYDIVYAICHPTY